MESTLKLVGLKAAGGMRHALLPSFTSEQFQNYILRSNADDFGEVKKTEESEEKIEDSDGGEKEEEKGTEEDYPKYCIEWKNVSLEVLRQNHIPSIYW